jgi:hypothetical protein
LKNREGHKDNTKFFVGTEVEHTPAYGQKTLFVVGLQNYKEILSRALNNGCGHIYLGANQSFQPNSGAAQDIRNEDNWRDWNFIVNGLLNDNIWVTLDYDIEYYEEVLEQGWVEYNSFIPMISVKLPYINQLNYNACIKIDDKGFNESNPGVWVHPVQGLQRRKMFTDWTKYTTDEVIE